MLFTEVMSIFIKPSEKRRFQELRETWGFFHKYLILIFKFHWTPRTLFTGCSYHEETFHNFSIVTRASHFFFSITLNLGKFRSYSIKQCWKNLTHCSIYFSELDMQKWHKHMVLLRITHWTVYSNPHKTSTSTAQN